MMGEAGIVAEVEAVMESDIEGWVLEVGLMQAGHAVTVG